MRSDRLYAVALATLLPVSLISVAAPSKSDDGWHLHELMATLSKVSRAEAEFREEKTLTVLDRPLVLEGRLVYKAPAYLMKQVLKPRIETFEVNGDQLLVGDGKRGPRELRLRDYPMAVALVEAFRATFAGDLAVLKNHYEVRLSGERSNWSLRLEPREARLAEQISAITVKGTEASISEIETLEPGGDRSLMMLRPSQ